MSAVLEDEEEETEEQRYQRFFGPAESSTEDDASDEEEAPPAPPRLAIESEASALLAKLIGEVLSEAKTRPERETARLACAAAGSFLAQIPGAAGAFESEASREDVLAEGPSATLCVARGARFKALDDLNDAPPPPVDGAATWACLVGRPWPASTGGGGASFKSSSAVKRAPRATHSVALGPSASTSSREASPSNAPAAPGIWARKEPAAAQANRAVSRSGRVFASERTSPISFASSADASLSMASLSLIHI